MKLTVNFHNFANAPKKDCEDINASCEDVNSGCEDVNASCEDVNSGCEDVNVSCEDVNTPELIQMVSVTGFSVSSPASVNTILLRNIKTAQLRWHKHPYRYFKG